MTRSLSQSLKGEIELEGGKKEVAMLGPTLVKRAEKNIIRSLTSLPDLIQDAPSKTAFIGTLSS